MNFAEEVLLETVNSTAERATRGRTDGSSPRAGADGRPRRPLVTFLLKAALLKTVPGDGGERRGVGVERR